MDDDNGSVDEAPEILSQTVTIPQNGRGRRVSDAALAELAKIGAEDVPGVRVVSARVGERSEKWAAVDLTVNVEYSGSLSDLVDQVCEAAAENMRQQRLPDVETTQINVTVASVRRSASNRGDRFRRFWNRSVEVLKEPLGPWLVPILILLLYVFILWTITVVHKDASIGDVVLALLLVTPILIYAIASGKLTELKGPGGVEARFTAVAKTPVVHAASHDSVSIDELLTVTADTGQKQLGQRVQRFTEVQPIVMTITLGAEGYKTGDVDDHLRDLRTYIRQLSRSRNFALVAFLDASNNFLAFMPSWVFKSRLDDKDRAKELFSVIQESKHEKLLDYPGVVRDKVSPDFTNGEALSKMVKSNLDVIVVVDENNRLKGVIQREQVLTRMVLALTPTS